MSAQRNPRVDSPPMQRKDIDNLIVKKLTTLPNLYGINNESYAAFIENHIHEVLSEFSRKPLHEEEKNGTNYSYHLKFGKIRATADGLTRSVTQKILKEQSQMLKIDVEVGIDVIENGQLSSIKNLVPLKEYRFFEIPLLLNSKYDPNQDEDKIPYFLVRGTPRILQNQLVHSGTLPKVTHDLSPEGQMSLTYVKSNRGYMQKYTYEDGVLNLEIGKLLKKTNFVSLLRLYGIEPGELVQGNANKLQLLSIIEPVYSKEKEIFEAQLSQILEYPVLQIEARLAERLKYTSVEDFRAQLLQNFRIVSKLLENPDNALFVDHMSYKKVLTLGQILKKTLQEGMTKVYSRIRAPFIKEYNTILKHKNLCHLLRADMLTKAFLKVIVSTSDQSVQALNRPLNLINEIELISSLRKVTTAINNKLEQEGYRQVNPSEIGRLCPSHTPHSRATGLVESLALGSKISSDFGKSELVAFDKIVAKLGLTKTRTRTTVCCDDRVLGYTEASPQTIANTLRTLRKTLNYGVSVEDGVVYIRTTSGRLLKLVYPISKGKIAVYKLSPEQVEGMSMTDLISKGYVVYIDAAEEQAVGVAIVPEEISTDHTYFYPGGPLSFSYMVTMMPAANNNSGGRASLGFRLISQSLGKDMTAKYPLLPAKDEYLLTAEPGIVRTPFENDKLPIGNNVIVAIASHEDNTCEDAIGCNRFAAERGMFAYKKHIREYLPVITPKNGAYELDTTINPNQGLPAIGLKVSKGTSIIKGIDGGNRSLTVSSPGSDYRVEGLTLVNTEKGLRTMVTFSSLRKINAGQKFATRQGQKGIVGNAVGEYEFPCSRETGATPGFLISPCVFNSRLTMGPLMELILAKYGVIAQKRVNLDVIEQDHLARTKEAENFLQAAGMDRDGYQKCLWMNSMNENIFTGIIKLLLLEHHASDKAHIRLKGAVDFLTRQPCSGGKKANGGLRFGEMERDAAYAHGAVHLLRERLTSDKVQITVCRDCKTQINDDLREEGLDYCVLCKKANIARVTVPYALLLLLRVIRGAGIELKIDPEAHNNYQDLLDRARELGVIPQDIISNDEDKYDETDPIAQ